MLLHSNKGLLIPAPVVIITLLKILELYQLGANKISFLSTIQQTGPAWDNYFHFNVQTPRDLPTLSKKKGKKEWSHSQRSIRHIQYHFFALFDCLNGCQCWHQPALTPNSDTAACSDTEAPRGSRKLEDGGLIPPHSYLCKPALFSGNVPWCSPAYCLMSRLGFYINIINN